MKILMLNHEFPPVGGGASPVTGELCRHLVQLGHEVDVVTMRCSNLPRHENVEGINVYRTFSLRKKPDICHTHEMASWLVGAVLKARRLARRKNHDIIHCHFIIPAGPIAWLTGKLSKIPFVITCHGSDVPGYNPERFGWDHKLLSPVWQFLVRRTPLLISPSESLKQLILRNCPCAKVTVVPNGINLTDYDTAHKQKSILMCSRILPRKGFQYAIEAIKKIQPDWQVHVVGDGPYLPELKRLAADSKTSISFWGWLDQKDPRFKQLYETSSIFIMTSEAENFPVVLLEAMSAGLAVITSTAGGCSEVTGDTALLVEPRSSDAIRKQLEKLINSQDLRNHLSRAALARVRNFAWPKIAQAYLDCYHMVL
jgi:glycosyltransferase involved in cell wall biosynthesis